ncbi:hypothetical protein LXM50_01585 [Microbacterium sp. Au-Mic1]|uniref:hypothetical protein n=1 Tax=Microbacterium sp. Au-Mic1 TaxID=2906457 RepID=UPI001E392BF9|nr:hypothetical protein [Microbacterium sp. Au-Mic1]MCE4024658.1 hypothetical protein [Microbacterium sp. Au-Mic1]
MNKTAVFITFVCLAAVGLLGAVAMAIFAPEGAKDFATLLITILGLATTAGGTFYALGRQGEQIQKIDKQTNGTLSALREENDRLTRKLEELARGNTGPINTADGD